MNRPQRLDELHKIEGSVIDLDALKKANTIPTSADRAKVVLSGEIKKAGPLLKGIGATRVPRGRSRRLVVRWRPCQPPKPSKLVKTGLRTKKVSAVADSSQIRHQ